MKWCYCLLLSGLKATLRILSEGGGSGCTAKSRLLGSLSFICAKSSLTTFLFVLTDSQFNALICMIAVWQQQLAI